MKAESVATEWIGADLMDRTDDAPGTLFCLRIVGGKLKLEVEIDKTISEEDGRFVFALVTEFASYWRERK